MSAAKEVIAALVAGGMDALDAAELVARAAVEMTAGVARKTPGAIRQQRYRERQQGVTKRNESVTRYGEDGASQSVTKRNEVTDGDAASLSKEVSKEDNKERKRERRGSQIPDGWRPDEPKWTDALARLGGAEVAERELRKFTNHALSKGRVCKNWGAAWNNWVDRALEWGSGNAASNNRTNPAAGRATAREAQLVTAMGNGALRYLEESRAARSDRVLSGDADAAGGLGAERRAKDAG